MNDIQWLQISQVFMAVSVFILLLKIRSVESAINSLNQFQDDLIYFVAKQKMADALHGRNSTLTSEVFRKSKKKVDCDNESQNLHALDNLKDLIKKKEFLRTKQKNGGLTSKESSRIKSDIKELSISIKTILNS